MAKEEKQFKPPKDYRGEAWNTISRKTEGSYTFVTEAMQLPPVGQKGVVQRDTVYFETEVVAMSTLYLPTVMIKDTSKGGKAYNGGN